MSRAGKEKHFVPWFVQLLPDITLFLTVISCIYQLRFCKFFSSVEGDNLVSGVFLSIYLMMGEYCSFAYSKHCNTYLLNDHILDVMFLATLQNGIVFEENVAGKAILRWTRRNSSLSIL